MHAQHRGVQQAKAEQRECGRGQHRRQRREGAAERGAVHDGEGVPEVVAAEYMRGRRRASPGEGHGVLGLLPEAEEKEERADAEEEAQGETCGEEGAQRQR